MVHFNLDFLNSEKVYSIVSKAISRSDILGVSEHKEIDKIHTHILLSSN